MIPVRVPHDAPLYTTGGILRLQPDHPLHDTPCPVCDAHLADAPLTLVYVGVEPGDRKEHGWMTGSAVTVHAACARVAPESDDAPDLAAQAARHNDTTCSAVAPRDAAQAETTRLAESVTQMRRRLDQAVQGRDRAQMRVRELRDAEERVRRLAEGWAGGAPADDQGDSAIRTALAVAGRQVLAELESGGPATSPPDA